MNVPHPYQDDQISLLILAMGMIISVYHPHHEDDQQERM